MTPPTKKTPVRKGPPPAPRSLRALSKDAQTCRNCDLWRYATQTVFGEGSADARIMFIGEEPGDQEDLQGRPFVGPAGKLLRAKLTEVGIPIDRAYFTNVIKHFKFEPRGKRRIHKKPAAGEIKACRVWLDGEIAALKPQIIVCLGATAAQALLGRTFRVTQHRGEFLTSPLAPYVMATVHPSSILRAPDPDSRQQQELEFSRDLQKIAAVRL